MKENLLKLISELTGKLNPPLWTLFVKYFYKALQNGSSYDAAKEYGQKAIDNYNNNIGIGSYSPETKYDYSIAFNPLLPNFGSQEFIDASIIAKISCDAEKVYSENDRTTINHINSFLAIQNTLNSEQKLIAERWDDSKITPPGHLLTVVLANTDDEKLISQVIEGLYQAAVGCWSIKYSVKQMRPVEAIRIFKTGVDFISHIKTPPHPSCPSGHSTFSGVVSGVLRGKTNNPIYDPITKVTYSNFDELQKEASISRVYGGIHFLKDCEIGTKLGNLIAEKITKS